MAKTRYIKYYGVNIGLVISGIDDTLLNEMNVGTKYHCLGLFSSRTGAAGQALNKAFGEAFGFMAGSPAAIGLELLIGMGSYPEIPGVPYL